MLPSMVRFLVLYPQPTDPAAFDRHYMEVHVPLAKRLPGLRSYTLCRRPSPIRGPEPYYQVAELDWDDMDSLQRDFASPLGEEVALALPKRQNLESNPEPTSPAPGKKKEPAKGPAKEKKGLAAVSVNAVKP